MCSQQFSLFTGAHGFQVRIAERIERAGLLGLAESRQLCERDQFALLQVNVVPVTGF
ncbi:hypothetical protein D3C78_735560 [compost metagenome]